MNIYNNSFFCIYNNYYYFTHFFKYFDRIVIILIN